jgi:hypothetical protein
MDSVGGRIAHAALCYELDVCYRPKLWQKKHVGRIDWRTAFSVAAGSLLATMLARVTQTAGARLSRTEPRQSNSAGVNIDTFPDSFTPIRQLQLRRFNCETWERLGEVLRDRSQHAQAPDHGEALMSGASPFSALDLGV